MYAETGLDPNNSVIKRLWCPLEIRPHSFQVFIFMRINLLNNDTLIYAVSLFAYLAFPYSLAGQKVFKGLGA